MSTLPRTLETEENKPLYHEIQILTAENEKYHDTLKRADDMICALNKKIKELSEQKANLLHNYHTYETEKKEAESLIELYRNHTEDLENKIKEYIKVNHEQASEIEEMRSYMIKDILSYVKKISEDNLTMKDLLIRCTEESQFTDELTRDLETVLDKSTS